MHTHRVSIRHNTITLRYIYVDVNVTTSLRLLLKLNILIYTCMFTLLLSFIGWRQRDC